MNGRHRICMKIRNKITKGLVKYGTKFKVYAEGSINPQRGFQQGSCTIDYTSKIYSEIMRNGEKLYRREMIMVTTQAVVV